MKEARNRSSRRVAALAAVAALAFAIAAPVAHARPSPKKAIWGPVERNGKSQFPIYKKLGVGVYEMFLPWDVVAKHRPKSPRNPADPAYAWPADVDQAVAQARRHHIRVLLEVMGTPHWA